MEAGDIAYRDCARDRGEDALLERMSRIYSRQPFAPPFLELDGFAIAQVANILMYLGERHDLAPSPMADRLWLNQLQLTVADMIAEVHNVHHPVRSEEHTSELQSLMRISYAVFCLKKKRTQQDQRNN